MVEYHYNFWANICQLLMVGNKYIEYKMCMYECMYAYVVCIYIPLHICTYVMYNIIMHECTYACINVCCMHLCVLRDDSPLITLAYTNTDDVPQSLLAVNI